MVEEKEMPVEQAKRISQDAPDDRCTVVRIGTSMVEPPIINFIRRHDIDPDDGNVIYVDYKEPGLTEACLCIPEEDDDPDTAGCRRVGKLVRHVTGEYTEEMLPATVGIEGPLFEEIIEETIVGPDTARRIEFERAW